MTNPNKGNGKFLSKFSHWFSDIWLRVSTVVFLIIFFTIVLIVLVFIFRESIISFWASTVFSNFEFEQQDLIFTDVLIMTSVVTIILNIAWGVFNLFIIWLNS